MATRRRVRPGRWCAIVAVGVVLVVAGCSTPPDIDGNLVNNWSPEPVPTQIAPIAGDCYASEYPDMLDSAPVDCAADHDIQVAYVGTLTGAIAARVTPPPPDSVEMKTIYAACQAPVKTFLGDDWHRGTVTVDATVPDVNGWTGGARWFRCDISMIGNLDDLGSTDSSGSVKGVLAHASKYLVKCVRWTDHKAQNTVDNTHVSSCSSWFNGEYAGFYSAPDTSWPSTEKKRETIAAAGCETVVGHFLGFAADTYQSNYVGWVAWGFDKDRWDLGDRTVRCYTYNSSGNGRFVTTARGIRDNRPKG